MTFQPTIPLGYRGVRAPTPINLWTRKRDPNFQDLALYTIGDLWYNEIAVSFWILADTGAFGALWIPFTSSTGGGVHWNVIAASQVMVPNNGYICAGGGVLALALPLVSALGDILEVTLDGSAGFTITQGAGQFIRFGVQQTTVGVGGSIASLFQGATLRMVCQTANLKWNVLSDEGNLVVS